MLEAELLAATLDAAAADELALAELAAALAEALEAEAEAEAADELADALDAADVDTDAALEDDELEQPAKPSAAANATAQTIAIIDFLIPCPCSS